MNDKIRELAIKARIQMCSEARLQEFAELIVWDCINITETAEPYQSSDLIKKYFGIE